MGVPHLGNVWGSKDPCGVANQTAGHNTSYVQGLGFIRRVNSVAYGDRDTNGLDVLAPSTKQVSVDQDGGQALASRCKDLAHEVAVILADR